MQQQQQFVAQTPTMYSQPRRFTNSGSIRGLAIAEIVLGILCVIAGITILALAPSPGSYRISISFSYGEGIWCGVWIIAAGGVGMSAARSGSSVRLMNTHMALSIVGAVFSAVLCGVSIFLTFYNFSIFMFAIRVILDILSFTSLVLLIVSSSLCCCSAGCCGDQVQAGQVAYVQTNPQNPSMMIIPNQGHLNQSYQPQMVVMQPAV